MKQKIVILLLILFIPSAVFLQTTEVTKREKNDVREGPGNYYPLLYMLPKGAPVKIIKHKDGWLQFQLQQQEMLSNEVKKEIENLNTWIAKNCLEEKKKGGNYGALAAKWESVKASPSSIAAAIRGFALRYSHAPGNNLDSLISLKETLFTPAEYIAFKEATEKVRRPANSRGFNDRYRLFFSEYFIPTEEEGIGLGIASRIASDGLVTDRETLKYINMLTTYLTEATGAYDKPFFTFILRDSQLKAFSVPGGYIFLTEGMVSLCDDESELAAVIAQEMIHIILEHGIKEIAQRTVRQRADLAMKELDEETGGKPDSIELELEQFAHEAYENIMKPRIQAYEEEADRGAIVILASLGYDPAAILRIINKLNQKIKKNENIEMNHPFAHLDFEKRYNLSRRFIRSNFSKMKGTKNRARFRQYIKK